MSKKRVAILGGGIGGLSAAHELAGDFEVHVYEADRHLGGKARSQFKAGTGVGQRRDLPGEHGFRFFPAFYQHVIDTMRRTPLPGGGNVADNLVGCGEMAIAEADRGPQVLPRRRPQGIGDFFRVVDAVESFFAGSDVCASDLALFGSKMLAFMCTCDERRLGELERMSFWDYVEGPRYTPRFQSYINSSRFMVAMDAKRGSARTIASKALQILLDFQRPADANDRVLNGPTTLQWLDPWEQHLRGLGVAFHFEKRLIGLDFDGGRIRGARFEGSPDSVAADYFVLALPLERAGACIDDAMIAADPALGRLRDATDMTAWMSGAQFYLRRDVPICNGHVAYADSPWALSSISQAQFWAPAGGPFSERYGDGQVQGVLSVDICVWDQPGRFTAKAAAECTSADEVLAEIWRQLQASLNGKGEVLRDEDRAGWRLDDNIEFGPGGAKNRTPLLVHPPGSWFRRPRAETQIHNLMLASDYVQTMTDLATMEGANEAARMAANAIFAREGLAAKAALFPVEEATGPLVKLAKELDAQAWQRRDRILELLTFSPPVEPTLEEAKAEQDQMEERLRRIAALP
ncbi:hydroxysqualene dehydroxylase [Sorangium sp. So ce131]|uniref:hydroxysqualene dehydroxylase n=1 Tax=Sorangium sp. So ce131 TaxID=3133282 RepID=UPI003F5FB6C1